MGSKQRWLSTLGALDVFNTIDAFEQMNLITIEVALTLRDGAGRRGPWIVASAYTHPAAAAERVLLASSQLQCSSTDFASLDVAAFRVLYMLDLALDNLDRAKEKPKSAAPGTL